MAAVAESRGALEAGRRARGSSRAGRQALGRGWVIATYVSIVFFVVWTVIPFIWMLLASVKTNKEIYQDFTLPFCIWMLTSYFRSIPVELEDAALIDGCDRLGVLIRIVLPLSAPAFVVVALFSFTQAWNEFLYALVFTNSVATRTVTVGLTQMLGEDVFYWGQMMAGALITALPPVIMYTLAQRLVIRGLMGGGVKG